MWIYVHQEFLTIFGQCFNVLNYKMLYDVNCIQFCVRQAMCAKKKFDVAKLYRLNRPLETCPSYREFSYRRTHEIQPEPANIKLMSILERCLPYRGFHLKLISPISILIQVRFPYNPIKIMYVCMHYCFAIGVLLAFVSVSRTVCITYVWSDMEIFYNST